MHKFSTVVTFDNGNSHPHLGVYQEGKRIYLGSVPEFLAHYPHQEWKEWTFIVSHVGKESEFCSQVFSLPNTKLVKDFRSKAKMGNMPIAYTETLGDDRLVQAYSLFKSNTQEQFILIDAGTFIKFDALDATGFKGGYIFPGLATFLKSYNAGANLPLLKASDIPWQDSELPHSTPEAILKATGLYLDSLLNRFCLHYPEAHFVVTGGSGSIVFERLKFLKTKNISINPYLIHDALFELSFEAGVKK